MSKCYNVYMIKECKQCNKEFKAYGLRKNTALFCSRTCKGIASRKPKVSFICKECNKKFFLVPSRLKYGNGTIYCSWKCYQKNPTRYWLGKKRPEIKKWLSMFQKGHIPWNKDKTGIFSKETLRKIGEASTKYYTIKRQQLFKEKELTYRAKHKYVENILGKLDTCEDCGKSRLHGHQIHWANKSGQYKQIISDWIRLCAKCHAAFDGNRGRKPKLI